MKLIRINLIQELLSLAESQLTSIEIRISFLTSAAQKTFLRWVLNIWRQVDLHERGALHYRVQDGLTAALQVLFGNGGGLFAVTVYQCGDKLAVAVFPMIGALSNQDAQK